MGANVRLVEGSISTFLTDGTAIAMRPVASGDEDCIARGFDRLSSRSRYLRFFSAPSRLSDSQLRYLANVDNVNHVAVAAFEPGAGESHGIGIARYVRLVDEPEIAEFAITVIDDYQGRGAGTILLDHLIAHASNNRLRVLRGFVLPGNIPMHRLMQRRGATRKQQADGSVCFELVLSRGARELSAISNGPRFVA